MPVTHAGIVERNNRVLPYCYGCYPYVVGSTKIRTSLSSPSLRPLDPLCREAAPLTQSPHPESNRVLLFTKQAPHHVGFAGNHTTGITGTPGCLRIVILP